MMISKAVKSKTCENIKKYIIRKFKYEFEKMNKQTLKCRCFKTFNSQKIAKLSKRASTQHINSNGLSKLNYF